MESVTEPQATPQISIEPWHFHQFYYLVDLQGRKPEVIADMFLDMNPRRLVVFCNSICVATRTANELKPRGMSESCAVLHQEMEEEERKDVLDKFSSGDILVLIATDILKPETDIKTSHMPLVINCEFPESTVTYLQRIGRSLDPGVKPSGVVAVISLVAKNEVIMLHKLENSFNTRIKELPEDWRRLLR